MAYEIDFIGSDIPKKDYDATAFRYKSRGVFVNCVFDGGTSDAGKALVKHISDYYALPNNTIDYVFCSHADLDHSSGLAEVFDSFKVNNLVINRPWDYIDELYELVQDGRITKKSLEENLRETYKYVTELEEKVLKQNTRIIPGIVGANLPAEMTIMSPSREFYIKCLAESTKTPEMVVSNEAQGFLGKVAEFAKNMIAAIWGVDAIREGEETSPENETSIVLYVKPAGHSPFMYCGDAGCRALKAASEYASTVGKPLTDCSFVQVPHHGGRHNVSPSILDAIIGKKVKKGEIPEKTAFVSVSTDSDHPRKCVANAFINRGCKVFVCRSNTIWHHHGDVPDRNWGAATAEKYSSQVEVWDN